MILITAPARETSQALLDEIVTLRDDSYDDVTTEEPLLKKCIVDGNFYSHSQTVTADKISILANFDKENFFSVR